MATKTRKLSHSNRIRVNEYEKQCHNNGVHRNCENKGLFTPRENVSEKTKEQVKKIKK